MKRSAVFFTRAAFLALAAAVAAGAGAYAAQQRSLRELAVVPDPAAETVSAEIAPDGAANGGVHYDPFAYGDTISLQGYAESPEKQAMEEWSRFLSSYDADGALLAAAGNGPTGLEERYDAYFCYTREMADALDAIAAKYGLALHGASEWYEQAELFDLVGGPFLTLGAYGGYRYPDGTLQCDEEGELPDCGAVWYQLRRTSKGVIDEVGLNVGDAAEYEQWPYETASGANVLLALGSGKALAFADLPESFVAINVLAGTESGLTREALQTLADSVDFSLLG